MHLSSKMGRWDLIWSPPKIEPFKVPPQIRGRKSMDTVRWVPAPTIKVGWNHKVSFFKISYSFTYAFHHSTQYTHVRFRRIGNIYINIYIIKANVPNSFMAYISPVSLPPSVAPLLPSILPLPQHIPSKNKRRITVEEIADANLQAYAFSRFWTYLCMLIITCELLFFDIVEELLTLLVQARRLYGS